MDPFPSAPVKAKASILPGLIVADVEAGLIVQLSLMVSPGKIDSSDERNLWIGISKSAGGTTSIPSSSVLYLPR